MRDAEMGQSDRLQYDASYPLFGIGFSHSKQHTSRLALGTLVTGPSNKLLVIDQNKLTDDTFLGTGDDFRQLAQATLPFPASKVGWEPETSGYPARNEDHGGKGELIATTGDVLRIWEMGRDWSQPDQRGGHVGRHGWTNGGGYSLSTRSVLSNSKSPQLSLPPVTSFSWNSISPNSIVTCSIDTTATLWDINTSQALTQLIAHDRAVYDLSWLPQSSDIFVSVGADGSLRAFDLRTLEHSTILYESSEETPLARIAFSNREQHMLACFGLDDKKTLILDMRSPGQPVAELLGHQASLSAIGWGSGGSGSGTTSGGWIASCGDDSQILLYDLTEPLPADTRPSSTRSSSRLPTSRAADPSPNAYALSTPGTPSQNRNTPSPAAAIELSPSKGWTAESEINNLSFSDEGDLLGCVSGSRLHVLRV